MLIQHAEDDGPVELYCPWQKPVRETLTFIERIVDNEVCGFNLAFDWYKLCQLYTTLCLLKNISQPPRILEYALSEPEARDGPCLRPRAACDLMLHARKGKYQNTMKRADLRIRRVPVQLAYMLADELERRVQLPDIFFAKRKDRLSRRWQVEDIKSTREFRNVVLKFAPSTALKHLAVDAGLLREDQVLTFGDIDGPIKTHKPEEFAFAPFALAVGRPGRWNRAWPEVIEHHIRHWTTNEDAIRYATMDVDPCTRGLYEHLDRPAAGDVDSELACQVGAAKWKGFAFDIDGVKQLKVEARKKAKLPFARSQKKVMEYLVEVLHEEERIAMEDEHGVPSTKKVVLEALKELKNEDGTSHPVAQRAKDVLDTRIAKYLEDFYDKLLIAGRLHCSTVIIGARSSRMSGGQESEGKSFKKNRSINPQGISKKKPVRSRFPLAFKDRKAFWRAFKEKHGYLPSDYVAPKTYAEEFEEQFGFAPNVIPQEEELDGGDAVSFEVNIAVAYYNDPQMREDVTGLGPDGKPVKIHAHIGTLAYPNMTYQQVRASSGGDPDYYTRAKSALFALIYFGNAHTLKGRLGIDIDDATEAEKRIMARYKEMGRKRMKFETDFVGLKQPKGQGTKIYWNDPKEFVESMLGDKRFFTSENEVSKRLYDLANALPPEWKDFKMRVQRRRLEHGGDQTAYGAATSALYGAAFSIQTANMRAAGNHVIQSTGARLTKILQELIWELQPRGIHPWLVRLLNIHDELMVARRANVAGLGDRIAKIVKDFVTEYKAIIPLLDFEWDQDLCNWAGVVCSLCVKCHKDVYHDPSREPRHESCTQ